MNCPRCNTILAADARFCGICGYAAPASNGSSPQANSSLRPPLNNEATQWAETVQAPVPPQGAYSAQPAQPEPVNVPPSAPPTQPVSLPQPQAGSWPQQPVQAGWTPANQQPPAAYPPGMVPGTMNSAGVIAYPPASKRKGRGGRRALLAVVLLLGVLAGVWFLGVRPYVHNLAQAQLDQALNDAQSQILLFQAALPPGRQIIHADEASLNNYLSAHDTDQLQNLHATISPDGVRLDFTAYGFSNTVTAMLVASGGALQVTNVQEQGILGLVMSSDELTTTLNNHFGDIGRQLHRTIEAVTLHQHEIDIQIN